MNTYKLKTAAERTLRVPKDPVMTCTARRGKISEEEQQGEHAWSYTTAADGNIIDINEPQY